MDRLHRIVVLLLEIGIVSIAVTSAMTGAFFVWSILGSALIEAVVPGDVHWKARLVRIVLQLSWVISIVAGILVGWAVVRAAWPQLLKGTRRQLATTKGMHDGPNQSQSPHS